jgi:hypothetical protein
MVVDSTCISVDLQYAASVAGVRAFLVCQTNSEKSSAGIAGWARYRAESSETREFIV